MTRQVLFLMALMFAMFVIAGIVLNRQLRRDAVLAARVRGVQRSVGIEAVIAPTGPSQSRLLSLVAGVGEAITRGGLLSASTLEELQVRLSMAGFRGRNALAAFIGAKLLALGGLPPLCWIAVSRTGVVAVAAHRGDRRCGSGRTAAARLRGADVAQTPPEGRRARPAGRARHARDMQRGRPWPRAGHRAGRPGDRPCASGRGRRAAQCGAGDARQRRPARRADEHGHAHRACVTARLGVTLVQTLQYGTPLSQALRTLSAEMRQEALTRFEARAGRLPALLTVPMIVFILPCVFLIVGGPAIVHVMQLMHQ